jgi:hypothetical protein
MLSATSHVRVQVDETRMDVIRWIRKRWIAIREAGAFDPLEGWAIKEISEGELSLLILIFRSPSH